jgi:hypothetical protein
MTLKGPLGLSQGDDLATHGAEVQRGKAAAEILGGPAFFETG